MLIRDVRDGDAPAVARLLDQLGYPADPETVSRRLARFESSGADRLFVAEIGGEVVGLAGIHVSPSLEYDGDAAKVSALVVDERHRRQGIATALLRRVEHEARMRGCVLIFLTTGERRKGAHEFYRRLGWEETGRRFAMRLSLDAGPPSPRPTGALEARALI